MAFSQAGEDAERLWDERDAEERALLAKRNRALQLNPEWYESSDQMMEDIRGRKTADEAARKQAVQSRARSRQGNHIQGQKGFATNPMQSIHDGFIQQFGPAAQGRALQAMANDVTDTIRDENDSRVAQEREARRMQHEKEMEHMRLQALIQRLQMQSAQAPRPAPGGQGGLRVFNPQTRSWDDVGNEYRIS